MIESIVKVLELTFERDQQQLQSQQRFHTSLGSQSSQQQQQPSVNESIELRRAMLSMLFNLLAYSHHSQDLILNDETISVHRPKLLQLLITALQTETDATNIQMLFAGLSLALHDLKVPTKSNQINKNNNNSAIIQQESFIYTSSQAFLIKSLHLTCHLLINVCRNDTQTSLSALELLTTIARVSTFSTIANERTNENQTSNNNEYIIDVNKEYRQAIKWICDYICNQCSRPPPAHSRDMHSTIVAAYQCLSVWLYNHPSLLNDSTCVATLMAVIELGVSGQKSRRPSMSSSGTPLEVILNKGDKVMKPSSMRVRDAAESLLNVCMVNSSFETHRDNNNQFDSLNEISILEKLDMNVSLDSFKYFCDEDSVIYSLIDGSSQDARTKDSVICLLRTPYNNQCLKFKFKYYCEQSREKIIANRTLGLINRPFSQNLSLINQDRRFSIDFMSPKAQTGRNVVPKVRFFPESLENSEFDLMKQTGLNLDDYCAKYLNSSNITKLTSMQALTEKKLQTDMSYQGRFCEQPQSSNHLEASRLLSAHLGLNSTLHSFADNAKVGLASDLQQLDSIPTKNRHRAHIFYVAKSKLNIGEMFEQSRLGKSTAEFCAWIDALGYREQSCNDESKPLSVCWSDLSQEISFTVPRSLHEIEANFNDNISIFLYWLEWPDDINNIELLEATPADKTSQQFVVRFFISSLKNGLYKVNLTTTTTTSSSQQHLALPLSDGMIVRSEVLADVIRESVCNICHRRRLDADSYQPPHVKRRLKIQKICSQYKVSSSKSSEAADFYSNLFRQRVGLIQI